VSYYRQGPHRPAGFGIGVPPVTPCVKALMIACGAVWLVQVLTTRAMDLHLELLLGLVPARVLEGWVWQLVTYMFLHDPRDPMHLLFNLLQLWMFAGELERVWGARGFLRFYAICGLGAGVSAVALGLIVGGISKEIPTGASGALFGLLVAYAIVFARRTILFMLIFPMQARTMALILVGLNLFYLFGQPGGTVSHIAHLGGALTGYLLLKRAWRIGDLYRDLRWKIRRRKFKMMPPDGPDDRWLH
jgi:membrane associated rhomboid family serine protease